MNRAISGSVCLLNASLIFISAQAEHKTLFMEAFAGVNAYQIEL